MTDRVALSKFHGLGNDFLVLVGDDDVSEGELPGLARRVCARHHGIGADGLLWARAGSEPGDWAMTLHNADGSEAEMSGNGIRCFAHAVIRHEGISVPTRLRVQTAGGERMVSVQVDPDRASDTVLASVDMGRPSPGPAVPTEGRPDHLTVHRMATWDLGNPHLVLDVTDPTAIDPSVEGPLWEKLFNGGMNVHFVAVTGRGQITQVTWERGAGVTEACGTGATAAALSARQWGLIDDSVSVRMPGGTVRVDLTERPILVGPSVWIADVQVGR